MEGTHRRLMWHGMCLFVLGLVTGFAEPHFANMRMGLAAHLEGLMNGTFLVALGAGGLAALGLAAWQETLVTMGFLTVGISIVASSMLVLWGLRAKALA